MKKEELDLLYHLLRRASNDASKKGQSMATGLLPSEEGDIILGLSRHLLGGGDYNALVKFSAFYGIQFLLPKVILAVLGMKWEFSRIVELGAGLGWLGRGLAAKLGLLPTLFVDKRSWVLIDVVADIETQEGRSKVLELMRPGDLVVASDLLHCLDSPEEVMAEFAAWPTIVLEYSPIDEELKKSYQTQINRYGAKPIDLYEYGSIFSERKVVYVGLDPYVLVLVEEKL